MNANNKKTPKVSNNPAHPPPALPPQGEQANAGAVQMPTSLHGTAIRTPDEILQMTFDPDDLYFENGLFGRGQPLTILGPGGIGKSRLLLQLAACTILKKDFLGMAVGASNLKWLVLQAENSNRRLQADLQTLKTWVGNADWAKVEKRLVIKTLDTPEDSDLALSSDATFARLARTIRELQPDVVAFAPLEAFAVGSLNHDSGMRRTTRAIIKLLSGSQKRTSVVILHHALTGTAGAAKATGYDRSAYGRGSKALHGWTRGQLNLAPIDADHNERLIVTCGKNSDGREFEPFGIKLNSATMLYEADPEFSLVDWHEQFGQKKKSKHKDRLTPQSVADFVRETPLKKKDLVRAIRDETGCEKSTAYNAIDAADGVTIRRGFENRYEAFAEES